MARGPSGISGWISWSSPTPEQQINKAIQDELFSILSANPVNFLNKIIFRELYGKSNFGASFICVLLLYYLSGL